MALTHIHGLEGELVWDDRYAPIFTTLNVGKWDRQQLREWYVISRKAMLQSVEKGHKVFFIGDISNVAAPDALIRKALADFQDEFDGPFKGTDVWIGQCYIIANVVMRGIVTAVQWMTPGGVAAPASTAQNFAAALKTAEQTYAKYGLPMPAFPRDYEFPAPEKKW
jgi:hypothetical protein